MNQILNLHEKISQHERQRVFKITIPILALFGIIQSVLNLFYKDSYEPSVIIAFVEDGSLLCVLLWAYFSKFKNLDKIVSLFMPVPLVCLFLRIFLDGGLASSATLWLFLFPLSAAYFVSYRYTYIISTLMTIGAGAVTGLLYVSKGVIPDPSYLIGVVANIWFITLTIIRYEKSKSKALVEMDLDKKERQLIHSHYSNSQIVQGFAHEINNPLCIINLFIQQLEFENKISEEEKNRIESNILRISDLITGLKERINKHNPRLSIKETPVGVVLNDVLSMFNEECHQQNIVLDSNLDSNSSIPLKVVEAEFFEAISYILNNAIENVEGSEFRTISVLYYEDLNQIHINDTGPDFTSETKTLALNTFYTTKPGHSGIGLSVAKELLKKNKISLSVVDGKKGKIVLVLPF